MVEWSITVDIDPFTGRPAPKLNIGAQAFYISIPELCHCQAIDFPDWGPNQYAGWYADQVRVAVERLVGFIEADDTTSPGLVEGPMPADEPEYVPVVLDNLYTGAKIQVWSSNLGKWIDAVVNAVYASYATLIIPEWKVRHWRRDRSSLEDINKTRIKL